MYCWTTQVCIDKKCFFTSPGHKNRQIGCNSTLAIARESTCYHQGLHWFINGGESNIRTQDAIGLDVSIRPFWIDNLFNRVRFPNSSQNRPAEQLGEIL